MEEERQAAESGGDQVRTRAGARDGGGGVVESERHHVSCAESPPGTAEAGREAGRHVLPSTTSLAKNK